MCGYKETTAFPSISKKSLKKTQKQHSNLNSQTSSKTLQELFFSPQISCSQQSLYKAVSSKCAGIESSQSGDCEPQRKCEPYCS
ncbi:unnamed protein product [Natator depressus]